jgi:hypothetical protein
MPAASEVDLGKPLMTTLELATRECKPAGRGDVSVKRRPVFISSSEPIGRVL